MNYSIVAYMMGVAAVVASGLTYQEAERMQWTLEGMGETCQIQLEEGL